MKNSVPTMGDLTELDALGLYMELETVRSQVDAALAHLAKAAEKLSEVVLKDFALAEAGKEVPKRPVTDHTTRSFVSGMLTGVLVQTNLVYQVVMDVQEACAQICPHCNTPETVN